MTSARSNVLPRAPLILLLLGAGLVAACSESSAPVGEERNADKSNASSNPNPETVAADGPLGVVPPGTPCPIAVHGDPVELASLSDATVYLPSDGAGQVTEAWTCGDAPVFMFDDIQLSFESGWENVKIPEKFDALARDYGGTVEAIQGLPAWVAPSSSDAPNSEVLFVKDGAAVRLLAQQGVPIDDLVALASSLDLATPVAG